MRGGVHMKDACSDGECHAVVNWDKGGGGGGVERRPIPNWRCTPVTMGWDVASHGVRQRRRRYGYPNWLRGWIGMLSPGYTSSMDMVCDPW